MGITDMIAGFIQEALDDAGGVLEMQRGDLAQRFGCVPSCCLVLAERSVCRGWWASARRWR